MLGICIERIGIHIEQIGIRIERIAGKKVFVIRIRIPT